MVMGFSLEQIGELQRMTTAQQQAATPRVYNRRSRVPHGAINIMRPSKWGNPFKITATVSRREAVAKFREYMTVGVGKNLPLEELRGKDLVCCCKPLACHGDVLVELANRR